MDFGKSFAYVLLGIVVFLLWTNWVKARLHSTRPMS